MSSICKSWPSFNADWKRAAAKLPMDDADPMNHPAAIKTFSFRPADKADITALLAIEQICFSADRISLRSFRRWVASSDDILLLAELDGVVQGYGLVVCNKGTRLARLYSLALLPAMRGTGLAKQLLSELEARAARANRLFMRLEVAKPNGAAIHLYENCGYRVFGEYSDYYDDHSDALRMQKTIRLIQSEQIHRATPWYQQTTEFTCGPAALMMAMAALDPEFALEQTVELDLWREATTIFMTSGHGGCHPVGLALAAQRRGFEASVYINTEQPLFVDGVRSAKKKAIMATVHDQFIVQAQHHGVQVHYQDISQHQVQQWLQEGLGVLILISTYRLDGKKTPHWVTVTTIDEFCLYVHDPDLDQKLQQRPIDCQYLPLARDDFEKMSSFGAGRLRTAVTIRRQASG